MSSTSPVTTPGSPIGGGGAPAPPVHPVADPAPLGLAAFATYRVTDPSLDAASDLRAHNILGGIGADAADLGLQFARKNTFGALAFSSYGAFWISYYVLSKFVLPGVKSPAEVSVAVGVFLLGWTIFTFYMIVPSLRVSGAVVVVFVLLTVTFVLLTIGAFETNATINKIGGWVGVATAAAAWYASFGGVVNETFKKVVIPLMPLAPGTRRHGQG